MRTFDDLRGVLAKAFHKEKLRLKSFGTKASSFDYANAITRHVQALRSESRLDEIKELISYITKRRKKYKHASDCNDIVLRKVVKYINERERALESMAKVLQKEADNADLTRPWKFNSKSKKAKKEKKTAHGSSRRSRNS